MGKIIKRNGKEIKLLLNSDTKFKSSYGTTNRLEPNILYLKCSTWIKHLETVKDFNTNSIKLKDITKKCFNNEFVKLNKLFEQTYLFIPNIKQVMVNEDDLIHYSFEVTIKQKSPIFLKIGDLNNDINNLICEATKELENKTNHIFEFHLKKKIN